MIYETLIAILLAIICFLLYKIYTLNRGVGENNELIPRDIKKELDKLDEDSSKEILMRFDDINSKISELEKRVEKTENLIEKLIEELG